MTEEAQTPTNDAELEERLAEVEDRHVEVWAGLLAQHGRQLGAHRPTARTKLLAAGA